MSIRRSHIGRPSFQLDAPTAASIDAALDSTIGFSVPKIVVTTTTDTTTPIPTGGAASSAAGAQHASPPPTAASMLLPPIVSTGTSAALPSQRHWLWTDTAAGRFIAESCFRFEDAQQEAQFMEYIFPSPNGKNVVAIALAAIGLVFVVLNPAVRGGFTTDQIANTAFGALAWIFMLLCWGTERWKLCWLQPHHTERGWLLVTVIWMIGMGFSHVRAVVAFCNLVYFDEPHWISQTYPDLPSVVTNVTFCGSRIVEGYSWMSPAPLLLGIVRTMWLPALLLLDAVAYLTFRWIFVEHVIFYVSDAVHVFLYLLFIIFMMVREHRLRNSFLHHHQVLKETIQNSRAARRAMERITSNILPTCILNRLVREESVVDTIGEASVLFSDVVGFTAWSASRSAVEIVQMLNAVYRRVDADLHKFGVEKVTTIGDAYWAACGVLTNYTDHASRITAFGLEIQRHISYMRNQHKSPYSDVRVRVGVATGEVTGGVIGRQQLTYQIFGTVNEEAERLEQLAPVGGVLVSVLTYRLMIQDLRSAISTTNGPPSQASASAKDIKATLFQDGVGYLVQQLPWKPPQTPDGTNSGGAPAAGNGPLHHTASDSASEKCVSESGSSDAGGSALHPATVEQRKMFILNRVRGTTTGTSGALSVRSSPGTSSIGHGPLSSSGGAVAPGSPRHLDVVVRNALQVDSPMLVASVEDSGFSPFNRVMSVEHSPTTLGVSGHAQFPTPTKPPTRLVVPNFDQHYEVDVQMLREQLGILRLGCCATEWLQSFADDDTEAAYGDFAVQRFRSFDVVGVACIVECLWCLTAILIFIVEASGGAPAEFSSHHPALFATYGALVVINVIHGYFAARVWAVVSWVRFSIGYILQLVVLFIFLRPRGSLVSGDPMYIAIVYCLIYAHFGLPKYRWMLGLLWCWATLFVPTVVWWYVTNCWTIGRTANLCAASATLYLVAAYRLEQDSRCQFLDDRVVDVTLQDITQQRQEMQELLSRTIPSFAIVELVSSLTDNQKLHRCVAHSVDHATIFFIGVPPLAEAMLLSSTGGGSAADAFEEAERMASLYEETLLQPIRPHRSVFACVGDEEDDDDDSGLLCGVTYAQAGVIQVKTVGDMALFAAGLQRSEKAMIPSENKTISKRRRASMVASHPSHHHTPQHSSSGPSSPGNPLQADSVSATGTVPRYNGQLHTAVVVPEYAVQDLNAIVMLAVELETRITEERGYTTVGGIHCGPVVSGVLGIDRLVYDVFGDTVNTASRVMSTTRTKGEGSGGMWMSPAAASILQQSKPAHYAYRRIEPAEKGESRTMKGKGDIACFRLQRCVAPQGGRYEEHEAPTTAARLVFDDHATLSDPSTPQ